MSQTAITDPGIREFTPEVYWSLDNSRLLLLDMTESNPEPIYITEMDSATSWIFGGWSPVDYRMLIIQRTATDDTTLSSLDHLWIYDPFSNEAIPIDSGDSILDPDW